jgi:hypothetical protein
MSRSTLTELRRLFWSVLGAAFVIAAWHYSVPLIAQWGR